MKFLLTGATGFIGSHLLRRLLKEGHQVIILKRIYSNLERIKDVPVTSYDINELDQAFLKENPDIIIHLATYYSKQHTGNEIQQMFDANVVFPTKILEAMHNTGTKFFINTGTFFEYTPSDKPLSESSQLQPLNLYASTKIAFENALQFYTNNKNIKAVTLKLFSPYGPDDNTFKLIPALIDKIQKGESFDMTPGEQRLDYTFVEDIIDAYICAINFITKTTNNYEAFNIGASNPVTIKEIAIKIAELLDKPSTVNFGAKSYSENEIMFSQADITKAKTMINWQPHHSITEGLKTIIRGSL